MVWRCLSGFPSVSHSFPHFFPTCFDILNWISSYEHSIKFECREFASIFVGVMPLLELRIMEIQSFPHFSLTCFAILSWHFANDFVLLYYRSSSSVVNLRQFCRSYAPFGTKNTENTLFSALFSYMLWHIELKFCIWLCSTVLHIKFECRQFASMFVGVHSFPHFSLTCFDILSWNFA